MRIVLIGNEGDRARVREMLIADGIDIAAEVTTLAEGRGWGAEVDALVIATAAPEEAIKESLTARELEVLELLAEGLSNQGIATRLHISEHTVKFHVASICGKLGAENRTDAVRRGVRRGLITL